MKSKRILIITKDFQEFSYTAARLQFSNGFIFVFDKNNEYIATFEQDGTEIYFE